LQDLLDHVLRIVRDPLVDVIRRAERKYLRQEDSLAHIGVSSLDVALDPQRIRSEELDRRVLVAVADATHDALEILVHLLFLSMLWQGAPRARTLEQKLPHRHSHQKTQMHAYMYAAYQVVFENLAHHIVRLTALGSTCQCGQVKRVKNVKSVHTHTTKTHPASIHAPQVAMARATPMENGDTMTLPVSCFASVLSVTPTC